MSLSILIVNWNSRDLLRQCLLSIRAHCADLAPQLVVVDGGSFDGCGEMLAREFPDVVFVQSEHNIGFGRSNNLGFTCVTGEAVLLLNPDTEIRPGALQTLLAELRRLPDAGVVSPRLLNSDYTIQSSVHALPRPIRQALDAEVLRRLLSPFGLWAPPTDFAPSETVAVEAVAGACMLLWAKTFRDVGGFSPEYFMYAEDMDLCLKVQRSGRRVYHVPTAEILHHSGASSSSQGGAFSAVMMRQALHDYMLVNRGRLSALTYRFFSGASSALRLLLQLPALLASSGERRRTRIASAARCRSVLAWSLGFERWTRKYSMVRAQDHAPTKPNGQAVIRPATHGD